MSLRPSGSGLTHPAILFKGRSVTYEALAGPANAFAAALADMGIKPGDRVALLLPNCPQFVIAELGAWKAGRSSPLNPLYSPDELQLLLADCGAETIVTLAPFYTRVKRSSRILPSNALSRHVSGNTSRRSSTSPTP